MKHHTHLLRAVLACTLLLALCLPAMAAQVRVDYTSAYQFTAADFTADGNLEGVYISDVPPSYQAELRIGSRVLRRGDILPLAALERWLKHKEEVA